MSLEPLHRCTQPRGLGSPPVLRLRHPWSRGRFAPGPGSSDLTPLVLCRSLQDMPSAAGPRGLWTQLQYSSARSSPRSLCCPMAGSG